ncbi:hypothetical protein JOF41_003604 [Saccharothrix coeruleofusca]|uniref:hypothetical protein n=1 Tax=Saccharothrix coeruleofusca TaxID=33919 RepID=UPI001AE46732|nr:hypothetical protein [Saccharothrix coeruleofusca]MBP2337426.1 hypothetical protein [Saccharothrix coeruleofusca]
MQPTPSTRLTAINRQAGLIAVSDGLAEAVAMLADIVDVEFAVDQVRVDPLAGPEQVLAPRGMVNGVDAVLPVRPRRTGPADLPRPGAGDDDRADRRAVAAVRRASRGA